MNRLIIIGNGFDLAHQMKTSYYNFIFNYVKNAFLIAVTGGFDDSLMTIRRVHIRRSSVIENVSELDEFMQFLSPSKARSAAFLLGGDPRERNQDLAFKWQVKNAFIEHLITECHHCRWVDIENEYYSKVIETLDHKNEGAKKKAIEELNESFTFLKELLVKYLSNISYATPNQMYYKCFFEKIKRNEIVMKMFTEDEKPKETLVLNFNYTSMVVPYFDGLPDVKINFIHGDLKNEGSPIIFGFGDELDKNYLMLEDERVKGFLHHVKSFWYFKTSNYHDLIRFIESEEFQVQIFGHSCGLSDRTMLNMVFEHANCLSIKIFYHDNGEWNNYTDLTEDISRHFNDKGMMRKKIVPFDKSFSMPQLPRS